MVRRSREIWRVQSKSISTSFANVFNAENAAILPLSIRCIQNCISLLNVTMSWTHLKLVYIFRAWSCVADYNV